MPSAHIGTDSPAAPFRPFSPLLTSRAATRPGWIRSARIRTPDNCTGRISIRVIYAAHVFSVRREGLFGRVFFLSIGSFLFRLDDEVPEPNVALETDALDRPTL
jgi:hypothetical protein